MKKLSISLYIIFAFLCDYDKLIAQNTSCDTVFNPHQVSMSIP